MLKTETIRWGGEISRLDLINTICVRVVEVIDPKLSEVVFHCSRHGQYQLVEVWLLPAYEQYWSKAALDRATLNSTAELLAIYSGKNQPLRHKMRRARELIQQNFLPHATGQRLHWHYSVQKPFGEDKPVLSILCGSHKALERIFDLNLRTR